MCAVRALTFIVIIRMNVLLQIGVLSRRKYAIAPIEFFVLLLNYFREMVIQFMCLSHQTSTDIAGGIGQQWKHSAAQLSNSPCSASQCQSCRSHANAFAQPLPAPAAAPSASAASPASAPSARGPAECARSATGTIGRSKFELTASPSSCATFGR